MGQKNEKDIAHVAAAAVALYQPVRRVAYTINGKVELGVQPCTAGQACEGIAQRAAAQGEMVPVKLFSNNGTYMAKVGKAIDVGDDLYVAAGVFTDSSSGNGSIQAVAYTAASAANEYIEIGRRG